MKFSDIFETYQLICGGREHGFARKQAIDVRKKALNNLSGLKKVAFDTRRINQETDYIPRRGLQNYHRSEKFVSESNSLKIRAFSKLRGILDKLKLEYGREPAWQDSYSRILASAINKGLRTNELDGDFSDAQPSMASLAYLEELMDVRYRLTTDNLLSMSEDELRKAILAKDELLTSEGISQLGIIKPNDVGNYSYDHMVDKMLSTMAHVMSSQKMQTKEPDDLTSKLFNVKATKDSPEVERTVTITIKDKIVDAMEKKSEENKENVVTKTSADDVTEDME